MLGWRARLGGTEPSRRKCVCAPRASGLEGSGKAGAAQRRRSSRKRKKKKRSRKKIRAVRHYPRRQVPPSPLAHPHLLPSRFQESRFLHHKRAAHPGTRSSEPRHWTNDRHIAAPRDPARRKESKTKWRSAAAAVAATSARHDVAASGAGPRAGLDYFVTARGGPILSPAVVIVARKADDGRSRALQGGRRRHSKVASGGAQP